jgi:hypothetical protein
MRHTASTASTASAVANTSVRVRIIAPSVWFSRVWFPVTSGTTKINARKINARKSMIVRGRMRHAGSMSRPVLAARPGGRIARPRPRVSWRCHHPPRLARREQGRIGRLGICLTCRRRPSNDGKQDGDYGETDHEVFLYRLQMSRLRDATFTGTNMFRHARKMGLGGGPRRWASTSKMSVCRRRE